MPLRFHWRLPLAGEEPAAGAGSVPGASAALPDLPAHVEFCHLAERSGIDSLLTACGYYMPDPVPVVAALGPQTESVRFLLAYRPGLASPTFFVQQVNTLSALSGGRLSLNIVVGHSAQEQRSYGDYLEHDERYRRADEFLSACRAFWRRDGAVDFAGAYFRIEGGKLGTPFVGDRQAPEVYLGGGSPLAREIALKHADCWLRLGDTPEKLRPDVEPMRERGIEVGVRMSIVARPTREEAVQAAYSLVETGDAAWVREVFASSGDSSSNRRTLEMAERDGQWPTSYLWTGAVARRGVSAVCLVGTPDEIVSAVFEYRDVGVTQFILSGWPNTEALSYFGREILPRIRARERAAAADGPAKEGEEERCSPCSP